MKCPNKDCKSENIKVSGTVKEFPSFTHRFLVCDDCKTSFQTVEKILIDTVKVKFYDKVQEEMDFEESKKSK
jgi:transcriptional regulator NrdR family protein